jgi:hypothetical protein
MPSRRLAKVRSACVSASLENSITLVGCVLQRNLAVLGTFGNLGPISQTALMGDIDFDYLLRRGSQRQTLLFVLVSTNGRQSLRVFPSSAPSQLSRLHFLTLERPQSQAMAAGVFLPGPAPCALMHRLSR